MFSNAFYSSVILLHNVVEILDLADFDRGVIFSIVFVMNLPMAYDLKQGGQTLNNK